MFSLDGKPRVMLLDTIHGIIDRRVLLNYHIDPEVLQQVLPSGFRPKVFRGKGIGGVCMIRFRELRPRMLPAWLGLGSENAAHRIAVEWDQDDGTKEGVFIPRRDTNSTLNKILGGRVFPGIFDKGSFVADESADEIAVTIRRQDGSEEARFKGLVGQALPDGSLFDTVEQAASFFSLGATGYSATHQEGHYHGMELRSLDWSIQPMQVEDAHTSFFSDRTRFPEGSVELDCALVMRGIKHEWHSRPDLYYDSQKKRLSTYRPTV
ncbi:MAG: DUF2071 domain-containing protein [Pyrinomonadaceae bacterium]|nr:DUF2071 domain-containing protein [Pyrinomonadaceae bacterium]